MAVRRFGNQQLITIALSAAIEHNDGLVDAYTTSIWPTPHTLDTLPPEDRQRVEQWQYEIEGWQKLLAKRRGQNMGQI
jgi:hypothetical protein